MAKHPYKMWVNVADFLAKTQHLSEAVAYIGMVRGSVTSALSGT